MPSVQEEIEHAHHLGKDLGRHRQACEAMLCIAVRPEVDQQTRADCYQQAGVYSLNAGQLSKGCSYLNNHALPLATNDMSRGNIKRDLARYHQLSGDHMRAQMCCKDALELHTGSDEAIMDRSFQGRDFFQWGVEQLDEGFMAKGLALLTQADRELAGLDGEDSRRRELYNKLHLASAMARVQSSDAQRWARDSLKLAETYGNWQHRLRAKSLIYSGWRGEWIAMKLLKSAQRVLNLAACFKG